MSNPKLKLPRTHFHISECPGDAQREREGGEWTLCGFFVDYSDPLAFKPPPKGSPWCQECLDKDG